LATDVRVGAVRNMKKADDFMWFFRNEELSLEEKEGFIGLPRKVSLVKIYVKMDCSMTGKGKFCLSGGKCNAIINRHINVLYLRE
jgi:hypothetical protein